MVYRNDLKQLQFDLASATGGCSTAAPPCVRVGARPPPAATGVACHAQPPACSIAGPAHTARPLAGPLVRLFDVETSHKIGILAARLGFFPRETRPDPPSLRTTVWGREFPNPLGQCAACGLQVAERRGAAAALLWVRRVSPSTWVPPCSAVAVARAPTGGRAALHGARAGAARRRAAGRPRCSCLPHTRRVQTAAQLQLRDGPSLVSPLSPPQAWRRALTRTPRWWSRCWAWALASWRSAPSRRCRSPATPSPAPSACPSTGARPGRGHAARLHCSAAGTR